MTTRDLAWWRANGENVQDHGTYLHVGCPSCGSVDNLVVGPGIHADGHALIDCKSGCSFEDIIAALSDAPEATEAGDPAPRRREPRPAYSPAGDLVARQDSGRWSPALRPRGISPSHLHGGLATLAGVPMDQPVVFAEGHGPAIALNAAGIPAVCSVTGKASAIDEVGASFLYGRRVVLSPDSGGEDHMDRCGAIVAKVAAEVLIAPPWPDDFPDNGDAADFIDRHGVEAMKAHYAAAVPWTPPSDALRHVHGDVFVFGTDDDVPAIFGSGGDVLWPAGEGLMLAGGVGAGKSTVLQQIIFHGIGVRSGPFLGFPVSLPDGVVGYVAADRPAQIRRSMRRMVDPSHADILAERLDVWRGPLPFDLAKAPVGALADFVEARGWIVLALDSLKDVASNTSDDEAGLAINRQFQELLARGMELVVNHHDRKGDGSRRSKSLDDIYGSRWLTAGFGSVVYIEGSAGSDEVEMHHFKPPVNKVGPYTLRHDHQAGTTAIDGMPVIRKVRAPGQGPTDALAIVVSLGSATTHEIATALAVSPQMAGRYLRDLELAGRVTGNRDRNTQQTTWTV